MPKTILVTGSAGFIGMHVSRALLERGDNVIGIDNFNNYYDPKLKEDRNTILEKYPNYKLHRGDICDKVALDKIFNQEKIDTICHLAAQAGVRYSLYHPDEYVQSNIKGTVNIFEAAQIHGVKNVVYASSSSVYGNNEVPWVETQNVDKPINPYGASKRAIEIFAYTYHYLYGLNMTGLRFFTVYGPWGRPDMAYFKFADNIAQEKEIIIRTHHETEVKRDFTFIDDITNGVIAALDNPVPLKEYNLGNSNPENLNKLVSLVELYLGKTAQKKIEPLQPGEFIENSANINEAKKDLNFTPKTRLEEGIKKFIEWYKEYYKI